MTIHEYGTEHPETIVLLHGGGLSWWNYREIAQRLEKDFHVVLPVLDGHGDSDAPFTTIQDNAARILAYIDQHLGGKVLALCGLSLGAQIAVELLHQNPHLCRFAMIESVSLIPSRLTNALIAPSFSSSYYLIKEPWFARLQFRALHIGDPLFEDYYRDTCKITKADMIAFLKANTAYSLPQSMNRVTAKVWVFVGGREQRTMRKSAAMLAEALPDARLEVLPGLYHGELSLNCPDRFTALLRQLLDSERN